MKAPVIHLENYARPDYFIDNVDLYFELGENETIVTNKMSVQFNATVNQDKRPLVLDGVGLELISIKVNERELEKALYKQDDEHLTVLEVSDKFVLEIVTRIYPQKNTALDGLYKSGDVFCTQNEPEGFRKITYFLDRPDVMATYSTTIVADKIKYPVLLSNGNKIDGGELDGGRHWTKWHDPFKKPSYLYALVAGDLGMVESCFTTVSGRKITLQIYVDKGNESKCDHAMTSLIKAMRWDEEVYGLEYDLDIFMIVAVNSFNMGAMENKGLNIFNSALVLANPQTATDRDFKRIESVIGHEYFHNWTGNRVTCRDWFQLTLKEGLTVLRDQDFSADQGSSVVQRIEDVWTLRQNQFPEDAGPNAHPIRPDSYIQINNFYTPTVYEKGAEVIRMVKTFIGEEKFLSGIKKYFELFDGQAVTIDDFLYAMELASGFNFTQFKLWYTQAGTPELTIEKSYDDDAGTTTVKVTQNCPDTPGQSHKRAFHIPFRMGLLDNLGRDLDLSQEDDIFSLTHQIHEFVFQDLPAHTVPSLNRSFSAPVKVNYNYSREELAFLMEHDVDSFNRWESGQKLMTSYCFELLEKHRAKEPLKIDKMFLKTIGHILESSLKHDLECEFLSMALNLPSESYLNDLLSEPDYDGIHLVREFMIKSIAEDHKKLMLKIYNTYHTDDSYEKDDISIGRRALKNRMLAYLTSLGSEKMWKICHDQFANANNMTDEHFALHLLVRRDNPHKAEAVNSFFEKWQHETLVVDKWLASQALSIDENTLGRLVELEDGPGFDIKVPNKVRALYRSFTENLVQFNRIDGLGYHFMADRIIKLDPINPQIASNLSKCFNRYAKLDETRQEFMGKELRRISEAPNLSKDTYEIVFKTLESV